MDGWIIIAKLLLSGYHARIFGNPQKVVGSRDFPIDIDPVNCFHGILSVENVYVVRSSSGGRLDKRNAQRKQSIEIFLLQVLMSEKTISEMFEKRVS